MGDLTDLLALCREIGIEPPEPLRRKVRALSESLSSSAAPARPRGRHAANKPAGLPPAGNGSTGVDNSLAGADAVGSQAPTARAASTTKGLTCTTLLSPSPTL